MVFVVANKQVKYWFCWFSTVPETARLAILLPLASAAISFALIRWMLGTERFAVPLDTPNERSLHAAPVPRTGGVGIVAGALLSLFALGWEPVLATCALALAVVSFMDDRKGLPIGARFAAHALAAAIFVLTSLVTSSLVMAAALIVATMWMTNLYNFMDGSDGLAGGMAAIGFGTYAAGAGLVGQAPLATASGCIAAAALAFLWFNFHPARIFMGDVGSVPLGFLAAALGLAGWRDGAWPFWFPVLVFSPFIVDASATLARRTLRGERFWRAHRSHYYQRLVQMGWGHAGTARAEYSVMIACAAAALWAQGRPRTMQVTTLAVAALAYAGVAIIIDRAWARRSHEASACR